MTQLNTMLVSSCRVRERFEIDIGKETYLTTTTENSTFKLHTVKIESNPFRPREGRNLKAFCIRSYKLSGFLRPDTKDVAYVKHLLNGTCVTHVPRTRACHARRLHEIAKIPFVRHSSTKTYLSCLFKKKDRHFLMVVIFRLLYLI